jgi:hypothetical protein
MFCGVQVNQTMKLTTVPHNCFDPPQRPPPPPLPPPPPPPSTPLIKTSSSPATQSSTCLLWRLRGGGMEEGRRLA